MRRRLSSCPPAGTAALARMFSLLASASSSRACSLDLRRSAARWEPRLEQVVSAGMHAHRSDARGQPLDRGGRRLDRCSCSGLTFAVPFAWQNLLVGFQSAFYLPLFFVPALAATACRQARWGGGSAGVVPVRTVHRCWRILAPVTILAVSTMAVVDRRTWRNMRQRCSESALMARAAVASPPLAYHDYLRVKSVADFVSALGSSLAWPWIDFRSSASGRLPLGGCSRARSPAAAARTSSAPSHQHRPVSCCSRRRSRTVRRWRLRQRIGLDFLGLGWWRIWHTRSRHRSRPRQRCHSSRAQRLWLAARGEIDRLTAQTGRNQHVDAVLDQPSGQRAALRDR